MIRFFFFFPLPCESASSCTTGKAIPLFICITRSLENRDKATQLSDPATTRLCIMLPLGTQYPCSLALYRYTKTLDPTVITISNSPPSKRLQAFFQVIDDYDIIIFIILWVLSPVNCIWMIAEFIYVPIIFFFLQSIQIKFLCIVKKSVGPQFPLSRTNKSEYFSLH